MRIRDIIEAATARQGEWKPSFVFDITDGSDRTSDASDIIFVNNEREQWDDDPFFVEPSAVAEYLVAFQPEHVALMEAVVEATTDCVNRRGDFEYQCQAVDALITYRREHGLE